jgi:hypothetical protein
MEHTEPRLKKLGILKLEDLYRYHVRNLVYDCLNDHAPSEKFEIFRVDIENQSRSRKPSLNHLEKHLILESFFTESLTQFLLFNEQHGHMARGG